MYNGWTDGRMNIQRQILYIMGGQTDGRTDGRTDEHTETDIIC